MNSTYFKKYIKYKTKYIQLLGGAHSDKSRTFDDFIKVLKDSRMNYSHWKNNLIKYHGKNVEKLNKIKMDFENKVNSKLEIDKANRINTIAKIEKDKSNIIRSSYVHSIKDGTTKITNDYIDSLNSVSFYIDSIQKFKLLISIITQMTLTEFEKYINDFCDECVKSKDNIALNEYICELIEFMMTIFTGSKNINPPFSIMITGNPGIGKSHAASNIGTILKASMLLPESKVNNVKKPDVIGQYTGQTAPKTYEVLRNGIGNIIFIDEAYSFAGKKTEKGYDSFGIEFINALTDFITEHIGLLCIVVAGYKYEMQTQFLDANSGLDRRFETKLNLERYSTSYIISELNKQLNNSLSKGIKLYLESQNYLDKSVYDWIKDYLRDFINIFDLQLNKRESQVPKNLFMMFTNNDNFERLEKAIETQEKSESFEITSYPAIQELELYTTYSNENIINYVNFLNIIGVQYGDLFRNQYADILLLMSITLKILSNISGDKKTPMEIVSSIIISYIEKKSSLKYKRDFIIGMVEDELTKLFIVFRNNNYNNLDIFPKIHKIVDEMNKNQQSFAQLDKTKLYKMQESGIKNVSRVQESTKKIGYVDLSSELEKISMTESSSIYLEEELYEGESHGQEFDLGIAPPPSLTRQNAELDLGQATKISSSKSKSKSKSKSETETETDFESDSDSEFDIIDEEVHFEKPPPSSLTLNRQNSVLDLGQATQISSSKTKSDSDSDSDSDFSIVDEEVHFEKPILASVRQKRIMTPSKISLELPPDDKSPKQHIFQSIPPSVMAYRNKQFLASPLLPELHPISASVLSPNKNPSPPSPNNFPSPPSFQRPNSVRSSSRRHVKLLKKVHDLSDMSTYETDSSS